MSQRRTSRTIATLPPTFRAKVREPAGARSLAGSSTRRSTSCWSCRTRRGRGRARRRRRELRRPATPSGRCWSARPAAASRRSSRRCERPGVWPLSSLTPQTLLSGLRAQGRAGVAAAADRRVRDPRVQGPDDGADDAPRGRAQIIGQLREVADGRTEKSFGNGLRLEWEGKLGLSPASRRSSTSSTRSSRSWASGSCSTGCRRSAGPKLARRSLARRGHEEELRERIRTAVARVPRAVPRRGHSSCPNASPSRSSTLTDIVTRARSVSLATASRATSSTCPSRRRRRGSRSRSRSSAPRCSRSASTRAEAWRLAAQDRLGPVPAVRSAVLAASPATPSQ